MADSFQTPSDLTGLTVGRFKITARLGAGGMGEVYRAEDTQLKRTVAIKRLAPGRKDPLYRNKLLKEAQQASALNHPGIAGVYDVLTHDEEVFLVMEFIDGITLRQRMQSPIGLTEFFKIATECARALAAAHERGILHGDLKPENIMLTRGKNEVKLCDFGLARRVSSNPQSVLATTQAAEEILAGTPAYFAPEILLQTAVDVRADIFSLGIVYYELLAGKNPFLADTLAETFDRIRSEVPTSLDRIDASVPATLARIVDRMLEKDPARRYGDASTLVGELAPTGKEAQAESAPFTAVRASVPSTPNRRATQKTSRVVIALGALLLAAAAFPFALLNSGLDYGRASAIPASINLVVLPFRFIGADPEQEFFSQGLTDTLNTQLSKLTLDRDLQVVTAAEAHARRVTKPDEARKEFGANLALSGSVQYSGNSVRINCALLDTGSGQAVRSESITAERSNAFLVQDRVVTAVIQMLGLELRPAERMTLTGYGTSQSDAYDFYLQGRGYLLNFDRMENLDSAINVFRRALEIDPRYALAYAGLGEAYWRKSEATKSVVWIEPARAACEGALGIDPVRPEPHACLGMVLNSIGQYEKAAEQFQIALDGDPTNDTFYLGLATAYERAGSLKDAEFTYRRAIAHRPHYWATHSTFGVYLFRQGRNDEAMEMFKQVIALVPDSFRGYSNLGAVQFKKGQTLEAIASFEKSLSIRSNYPAASNLGTLYYFQGQYRRSADAFQQALEMNSTSYQVWGYLGDASRWAGDPVQSANAYRRARELAEERSRVNPRDMDVRLAIAEYSAGLGEKERALTLFREVLSEIPEDPQLTFRVAKFFEFYLSDRNAAFDWLAKAIKLGQSWEEIDHAPTLAALREDPRFRRLRQGS